MWARASSARSTLFFIMLMENARTMWLQNSTEMPQLYSKWQEASEEHHQAGIRSKFYRLRLSHHHQVHQGHCVEADAPQPHDAEHVDQDHGYGNADHHGGPQLEAQQHRGHHEYRGQGHAQVESCVVRDGEVLLVEHVEHAGKEENTFQPKGLSTSTNDSWDLCFILVR